MKPTTGFMSRRSASHKVFKSKVTKSDGLQVKMSKYKSKGPHSICLFRHMKGFGAKEHLLDISYEHNIRLKNKAILPL